MSLPGELRTLDTEVRSVVIGCRDIVVDGLDSTVDDSLIELKPVSAGSSSVPTFRMVEVTAQVLDLREVGMGPGRLERT